MNAKNFDTIHDILRWVSLVHSLFEGRNPPIWCIGNPGVKLFLTRKIACDAPETPEDKTLKAILASDFSAETVENNPTNEQSYETIINTIYNDNGLTPPTPQEIDDLFIEVTEELPASFIPCPRPGSCFILAGFNIST